MNSTPPSAPNPVPPQRSLSPWVDPFADDDEYLAAWLTVPYWRPMPDDPVEAEAERSRYRAKAQAIIEGWGMNASKLCMESGDRFHLRFLRFGRDRRFISKISQHQVYRNHREVCPKETDAALGGDPAAECALCEGLRTLHSPFKPYIVSHYWVYAVVLAGTFPERSANSPGGWAAQHSGRRRFTVKDVDRIGRPHRICLGHSAAFRLKAFAKHDPNIFDWIEGSDFELSVGPSYIQTLRRIRRGPIQLTRDLRGQERQRLSIESFLGEPHLYVPPERVMDVNERHWRLQQGEARMAAWDRLIDRAPGREGARRHRRMVALFRQHHREVSDLRQPGWDESSSTNPQPAMDRTEDLRHRLQTLLQYRDAMRRSSKAFWAQFDAR